MNLFVCTQGLEDHKMHDVQQRRGKKFDFFAYIIYGCRARAPNSTLQLLYQMHLHCQSSSLDDEIESSVSESGVTLLLR